MLFLNLLMMASDRHPKLVNFFLVTPKAVTLLAATPIAVAGRM